MSARSSSSSSPHPVLPPIITNESDRRFLQELDNFIEIELQQVDRDEQEQRYIVYKAAFNKVIDYVQAYKPLLNAIKAEYEDFIDTVKRGRREADFLSGKLQAMASEPSTVRNYKKRGDELEHKLEVIRKDNERLAKELQSLRETRLAKERRRKTILEPQKEIKRDKRQIPGLSIEQATDVKLLSRELNKLDIQQKELNLTWKSRYVPKHMKEDLKEQLETKDDTRDRLVQQSADLKIRRQKLKTALDAAQAYTKIQPYNQTIGDAVANAFKRSHKVHHDKDGASILHYPRETPSTTFEDDDPTREREAEMMLEYIEKFNELFEDDRYEEAAIHAANSPKGILRTMETLNKFKNATPLKEGRSPLLAFCDAVMSSVLALGVRPSEVMSQECVQCALSENRVDLLSHWISQERLTVTEKLGDMIVEYCNKGKNRSYLSLAEKVYLHCDAHVKTVTVLVQQGRIKRALEYALQHTKLFAFEWLQMLEKFPSPQLANALTTKHPRLQNKCLLPVGVVVRKLLDIDHFDLGMNLLQDLFIKGPQQGDKNETSALRQAVFDDDETTLDQWHEIVKQCQDTGYEEVALELLAAITVLRVMQTATSRQHTTMESLGSDNSDAAVSNTEDSNTKPKKMAKKSKTSKRKQGYDSDDDNENNTDRTSNDNDSSA